ncbi:MAG: M6 family metalloprotease domain-containing protein [Paludibacteraceae bacterium]|nr:M6 family metalloprotease domain-containing protein [Paludibacteraceae bacterium]
MRKILTYTLLLAASAVYAVIAKPGSGVYGDEYYHYRLDEKGHITAAASTMQRDTPRRPAVQLDNTFPSKGQVHSLVILVNFSDLKFVTPNPNEAFTKMLNEPGYSANYGTGSARDYFIASSYGQFEPYFDVYGPVNLGNTCAYYDANARQMVIDACDSLEHEIDWDKYDANDDGDIDNIFVYYAGHNEAEGGPSTSIWPHRSYVFTESGGSYIKYYYNGKSGKKRWLWDYACTSELRGNSGKNMCGIGTFCHEFSHVLGLDDLYDTKDDNAYTVGEWDIMCTGSYNNSGRTPPSYSAFERFMVGWLTPTQLTEIADYTLPAISDVPSETDRRPRAYLIASKTHNMNALSPNPKEYWLIENRQRVGWDEPNYCLPGTGLLISHITFDANKWKDNTPNNYTPLVYDIVEASGTNSFSSAADLYPGTGRITTFTPKDNKGNELPNDLLQQIRVVNGTTNILFRHGPKGVGFDVSNNGKDTLLTEVNDQKQVVRYEVTSLEISGKQLTDDEVYIYPLRRKIALSFDSVTWTTDTLKDRIDQDGTYQRRIYARYQTTQKCRTENDILQVTQKNEKLSTQYTLFGHSERAQLIGEVQTLEASDVMPYSFVARWEAEDDAEEYALHVFSIQQQTGTKNTKVGRKLSEHGETYSQDIFPLTIRTMELNYTQHWNNADAVGTLAIDAKKGDEKWVNIDSLHIRNVTKTLKKTFTFAEDKGYDQYRIRLLVTKGKPSATINSVNITSHYTVQNRNAIEMPNDQTEMEITGLSPSSEYYYYVTCQEEKGCQVRSTTRGPIEKVRTLPGTSNTGKQFTCLNQNGQVTAYLPEPAVGKRLLLVYSTAGQLVEKVEVPEMTVSVSIPTQGLAKGQIYAVKLVTSEKLTRKQIWAKFLY